MNRQLLYPVGLDLVLAWSSAPHGAEPPPPVDVEQLQVELAMTKLLWCWDFREIGPLPLRWRRELPVSAQTRLLKALVARLRSSKDLHLKNTGLMYVGGRELRGEMQRPSEGLREWQLRQDVFLENGRCAWAIELMLGCKLPACTEDVADEERKLAEQAEEAATIVNQKVAYLRRQTLDEQVAEAIHELISEDDFDQLYYLPVKWQYIFPPEGQ